MRRRAEEAEKPPETVFEVRHDAVNEQVVLAATVASPSVYLYLTDTLMPDHFLVAKHREIWRGLRELRRRALTYDPATLKGVAPDADLEYLTQLLDARPDAPDNLTFHVDRLMWDKARSSAAVGPVSALLDALKNPASEPERVRALARHVGDAFKGQGRALIHDTEALVEAQMHEVHERIEGHATFPYGIPGLDCFEGGAARLCPGSAPGQVTMVTGVSGSGKSTLACHIALGVGRQDRRVLYGAWEMQGGPTLELLACLSLGWSRAEMQVGMRGGATMTPDHEAELRGRMMLIGERIRFMKNPFRRSGPEKRSNERNLDLVQGLIADSGCDVFIADLWRRCLVTADPQDEEEALFRQQAMAEEMRVHVVVVHQQRLKDLENRPDKRPTREGMKGSSAYVEVADTILGVHRPALFKRVDDDKVEVFVLKQRYGKWPLGVEFDWSGEYGSIDGGRSFEYDVVGEGEMGELVGGVGFKAPQAVARSKRN